MHSLELEEIARRLALHIGIGVRVVSERNFRIAQHHCAMGYKIREQPAAHSGLQVDALDSHPGEARTQERRVGPDVDECAVPNVS